MDDALRVRVGQGRGDVGEHAAEERPDDAVARVRARRDPSVDHHRLDAAPTALTEQVRPDLRLHHDEQTGAHQVERPPHDERPVEGEIEDRVGGGQAAARDLLAGNRGRRHEQSKARITRFEVGGKRARGQRLADRDGMDPDRFLVVDVEGDRQKTEPLPQAGDVLLIADRLVDEVRRYDDKNEH